MFRGEAAGDSGSVTQWDRNALARQLPTSRQLSPLFYLAMLVTYDGQHALGLLELAIVLVLIRFFFDGGSF